MKRKKKQIGSLLLVLCMVLSMLPVMAYAEDGPIEIPPVETGSRTDITADFIDTNFLAEVRKVLGKGEGEPIYDTDNFAEVKRLDVPLKGIQSLAGIEHFTALETLDCNYNQLTELPELPDSLTYLYCAENQLTRLPELPDSLKGLNCYDNQLTELPELPSGLTQLACHENQLTELPELPDDLWSLECSDNQLTILPELPEGLTYLGCFENQLTELPVLPDSLTSLNCRYNQLTSLNISGLGSLATLDCSYNYIPSQSAVVGYDGSITTDFTFDPQYSISQYVVTVNGSYADQTGEGSYSENAIVTIEAGSRSDYSFAGWTSADGVTFDDANNATTTFTMPAKNITVTANWSYIGGEEGDDGVPSDNEDSDSSGNDSSDGDGTSLNSFHTLTDGATGITVSGNIQEGAVLTVGEMVLSGDEASDVIRQWMENGHHIFLSGRDISLSGGFTGTLTLTLPVGAQYNGKTVTILHGASDGLKTYSAVVTEGTATINVTSLSPFAVFLQSEGDNIPQTGISSDTCWWWALLVSGTTGLAIMAPRLIRRYRNKA